MNSMIDAHYRENYSKLVKVVLRRVGYKQEIAEECVQEAYARAIRFFPTFDEEVRPFEAWFTTILNNSVNDIKRSEKVRGMADELPEDLEDEIVDRTYPMEVYRHIQKEITEVANADHREILDLHFNKDLRISDIHKVTKGFSIHNIKSVVRRFRILIIDKYGLDGRIFSAA